jgi:hypothetical protein
VGTVLYSGGKDICGATLPTAYRDGDLEQMESEQRKTRARRGGNERGGATTKHARTFWTLDSHYFYCTKYRLVYTTKSGSVFKKSNFVIKKMQKIWNGYEE